MMDKGMEDSASNGIIVHISTQEKMHQHISGRKKRG